MVFIIYKFIDLFSKVKIFYSLPQPCKFLIETIFAKRMSVLESKKQILAELKEQCNLDIPLSR